MLLYPTWRWPMEEDIEACMTKRKSFIVAAMERKGPNEYVSSPQRRMRRSGDYLPTTEDVLQQPAPAPEAVSKGRRKAVGRVAGAAALILIGGSGWAVSKYLDMRATRRCESCAATNATATAQTQEIERYGGTRMDIIDREIQFPNGRTGLIVAPQESTYNQVQPLPEKTVLILAVGQGILGQPTIQDGRVDGDVAALRNDVQNEASFYDYASKGYSGEVLAITINGHTSAARKGAACNMPVFCLMPGENGTPAYQAFTIPEAQYRAHAKDILTSLHNDVALGLGDRPYVLSLNATDI